MGLGTGNNFGPMRPGSSRVPEVAEASVAGGQPSARRCGSAPGSARDPRLRDELVRAPLEICCGRLDV